MTDEPNGGSVEVSNPIMERAADLDTMHAVLCRLCESDDEVAAVKRVLGVEAEEKRVMNAFTPEPPPIPEFKPQIDHLERAHAAIARYGAWVESYPDDDPTPLRVRERTLRLARLDLARLEAQ